MASENEIVVVGPGGIEVTRWTLPVVSEPDLALVDELAHLQLTARRLGYTIRVRNACAGVSELLDLAGLRLEAKGEAEGGEQVGVEEVVMPDDPVA